MTAKPARFLETYGEREPARPDAFTPYDRSRTANVKVVRLGGILGMLASVVLIVLGFFFSLALVAIVLLALIPILLTAYLRQRTYRKMA